MVTGQAGPIWKVPIMGEGMNLADLSWDPGGVVMETHLQADMAQQLPPRRDTNAYSRICAII
jgi:hypothetical protein